MIKLLVTHADTEAGRTLIRALEDTEWVLFAASHDAHCAGLTALPQSRRVETVSPRDRQFAQQIRAVCRARRIDYVLPAGNEGLLALSRSRWLFELGGTRLLTAPTEALELCLNRDRVFQACDGTVPTPLIRLKTEAVGSRSGRGQRVLEADTHGAEIGVYVHRGEAGAEIVAEQNVDGVSGATRTSLHTMAEVVAEHVDLRGPAWIVFRRDPTGNPVLERIDPWFDGRADVTATAVHRAIEEASERPPVTSNLGFRLQIPMGVA